MPALGVGGGEGWVSRGGASRGGAPRLWRGAQRAGARARPGRRGAVCRSSGVASAAGVAQAQARRSWRGARACPWHGADTSCLGSRATESVIKSQVKFEILVPALSVWLQRGKANLHSSCEQGLTTEWCPWGEMQCDPPTHSLPSHGFTLYRWQSHTASLQIRYIVAAPSAAHSPSWPYRLHGAPASLPPRQPSPPTPSHPALIL